MMADTCVLEDVDINRQISESISKKKVQCQQNEWVQKDLSSAVKRM
jgi:hypothetical protein